MNELYAVVTGASTGLGRCLAIELAGRGINTILVALPGEGLMEVRDKCRKMGTKSECFELDLTDKNRIMELAEEINSKYRVNILLNNAGYGGSKVFMTSSADYIYNMILLNAGATSLLTHELLENLSDNADAYILNVSSMASMTPTGFKTVYPATKAFVKHFSIGLREELKSTPVSVSVAILGPMPTQPEIISRIEKQGFIGKFLSVTPKKVARKCIDGMFKHKRKIIPGIPNMLSYYLIKFIPEHIRAELMTRSVRKNEIVRN